MTRVSKLKATADLLNFPKDQPYFAALVLSVLLTNKRWVFRVYWPIRDEYYLDGVVGKAEQGPEPEHEAEASENVFTESHPGGRLQQRRGDVGAVTLENGANLRKFFLDFYSIGL